MKLRGKYVEEKVLDGRHLFSEIFDGMIQASTAKIKPLGKNATYLDRVIAIHKHFHGLKFMRTLNSLSKDVKKNASHALRLKTKGDEYYIRSEIGSALFCYNLALSIARVKSIEAGEIYAQRGSLFLQSFDIDKALKDTLEALKCPCSKNLLAELKVQRIDCLGYIYRPNNAAFPDDRKNPDFVAYCENVIFKINEEKHPTIPSASTSVKMQYNSERGRNLVAANDLEPGTTLIVESPYVSVLDNAFQWEMKHCFWCYKKAWRTVPCETCVFAVYCSEKCKLEDYKSGHNYMCLCFPYLHIAELDSYDHLALKAICRAGPKYIYELFLDSKKQKSAVELIQYNAIKGFNPQTGLYDSDSYYQIQHLMTHADSADLNHYAWTALSLVKILYTKSEFFVDILDSHKVAFHYFVASLILQNQTAFSFNGVAMRKSLVKWNHPYYLVRPRKEIEGITGIFSLISTMNHSCEPNITWQQSQDGKLAIITKQKIKAGDEILFSYGYNYTYFDIESRHSFLWEGYRFKCHCFACYLKWPQIDDIDSEECFLCPNCVMANYSRLFLINHCSLKVIRKKGICEVCNGKFRLSRLKSELEKYEQVLAKMEDLIENRKYLQAIPQILECISYFQLNLKPPSLNLIQAQEILWLIYLRIIGI